jgi:hypothetical protein
METTSTTTFPLTVPSTTTPMIETTTTTTSTVTVITTPIIENVVISSYDEILPHDKTHIIIMSTIIPIAWIAFIVALIWMRKSTGVLNGLFHPFNNWSSGGESSGSYELNTVSEA